MPSWLFDVSEDKQESRDSPLTVQKAYYSSQLPGLTQKTKSGLLRKLWEQDHWKHFWAIAAKAYSELRDIHLGQITLEDFLKNTTGLLGVLPADQYFKTMGWALATDTEGQTQVVRTTIMPAEKVAPLTTNLSVRDVVGHCYEIGLVDRPARPSGHRNAVGDVMMSFAAAPSTHSFSSFQTPSNDELTANEIIFGGTVCIHESGVKTSNADLSKRTQQGWLKPQLLIVCLEVQSMRQSMSTPVSEQSTIPPCRQLCPISSRQWTPTPASTPSTSTSTLPFASRSSVSTRAWSKTTLTHSISRNTSTSISPATCEQCPDERVQDEKVLSWMRTLPQSP